MLCAERPVVESLSDTTTLLVPPVVGVPLRVAPANPIPAGSPDADQEKFPDPAEAVSVALYPIPVVPDGSAVVVIAGEEYEVRDSEVWELSPVTLSLSVRETLAEPALLVVPVRVFPLSAIPAGNPDAVHVKFPEPPVAARVAE